MLARLSAFVLTAFALAPVACDDGGSSPQPTPKSATATFEAELTNFTITMERGTCYGFCPAYTVVVKGDGTVSYVGERFVEIIGNQTSSTAPEDVARLLEQVLAMDFFTLPENYDCVVDAPSESLLVTLDQRTKRVSGCPLPTELRELEALVDEVAGTSQWIGEPGPPEAS